MFEDFAPKFKLGCLMPGAIIDNHAYEFYRLAPPGVMEVMIGVGLTEFSRQDVERVFAPLDRYLDQLMDRGVDMVIQNGVPLPILIGIEAHDRMVAHMAERTGTARDHDGAVGRGRGRGARRAQDRGRQQMDRRHEQVARRVLCARWRHGHGRRDQDARTEGFSSHRRRRPHAVRLRSSAAARSSTIPTATPSISAAARGSRSRSPAGWKRNSISPCCAIRQP